MIGRTLTLLRFEISKLLGRRTLLVPEALYSRRGRLAQGFLAPPFVVLVFFVVAFTTLLSGYGSYILERAVALTSGSGPDVFRNAWTTLANASGKGLLLALVFLLVLAGTAMAEEAQLGTLKAILLRPFRRAELVISKTLALFIFILALVLVLAAAGALTGSLFYDYGDVVDPEYQTVQRSSAEMLGNSLKAFALIIPPMFALLTFALFISTVIEQPGYSVGVAMGGALMMSVAGSLSKTIAPFIFVTHLTAPLDILKDQSLDFAGSTFQPAEMALAVAVSLVSGLAFAGLAMWRLAARDIAD